VEEQTDKVFIKNFSLVVIGLIVFTLAIIFLAKSVGFKEKVEVPSRAGLTEERIRPVADIYLSEENAAAAQQAVAEAAPAPAPTTTSGGAVNGEEIYNSVCAACHSIGLIGAPVPGSAEMSRRAEEKGMDTLLQDALNGLNAMPARGGRADLSDEQVKAAIEFMLK